MPLPQPQEAMLGGHAIAIVGYDDSKQMFTFQNSWGSSWGDKGFGYLPYSYLTNPQLSSDFWTVRMVSWARDFCFRRYPLLACHGTSSLAFQSHLRVPYYPYVDLGDTLQLDINISIASACSLLSLCPWSGARRHASSHFNRICVFPTIPISAA